MIKKAVRALIYLIVLIFILYTLGDSEAPGFGNLVAGFAREVAPGENLVAPGGCEVAPDGWPHDNTIYSIYTVKD